MINVIREKLFGKKSTATPIPEVQEPAPVAPAEPESAASAGFGILADDRMSGWFNHGPGEVFKGFAVSAGDVVLDVGCGDAGYTPYCARQGADVTFVDVDAQKVNAVHESLKDLGAGKLTPLVSDCNPLPLPDDFADRIMLLEVMEHVDDPKVFLGEMARVGKSGALYLITVPDPVLEKLQKKGLAPDSYFEKPNHIRIIERDEFTQLVLDAGLEIEKQDSYGFYWSMWWVFFWACKQDLSPPWHPLLQRWTETWDTLLSTEDGPRIKAALDEFMPKSQLIIARKP